MKNYHVIRSFRNNWITIIAKMYQIFLYLFVIIAIPYDQILYSQISEELVKGKEVFESKETLDHIEYRYRFVLWTRFCLRYYYHDNRNNGLVSTSFYIRRRLAREVFTSCKASLGTFLFSIKNELHWWCREALNTWWTDTLFWLLSILCFLQTELTRKVTFFSDLCDEVKCDRDRKCIFDANLKQTQCVCKEIRDCNRWYQPICASDGKSYQNECKMLSKSCKTQNKIKKVSEGECVPGKVT